MTRPDECRPRPTVAILGGQNCRAAGIVAARWCSCAGGSSDVVRCSGAFGACRTCLAGWRRVGARRTVAAGPVRLASAACTSRWTSTRLEKRGILPEERQAASAGRQRAARRRAARCACATPARICGRRGIPAPGIRARGIRASAIRAPVAPCARLHAAMERCGAVAHDCLVDTQPLHFRHRSD
ncbi:hypothetical protein HDG40_004480 [Paraburkholderia sp. JPY158]|uniref:Uncharacterized protein n=1 Tax=Paraburkholderia atlantica TaxID=2654982 RepID=A0A7W8QAY4_PARAM|nr:hypothetical protein [Paraburkholderia atlantica]